MWLLNTETILPEAFPNPTIPRIPDYAILSHRWMEGEVSFQQVQNPSPETRDTPGYEKVQRCCEQAASVGFKYVWIDTCCIDKTNQTELTEALNSMYLWYQNSRVCFGYLVDVPSDDDPRAVDSKFRKSKWFTRGWTLQELLAPLSMIFFSEDWTEIGTKSSLQDVITEITGISPRTLLMNYPGDVSVAQRMAWASGRNTAEVEDKAYSLLGFFGVNMPMTYGEKEKAFERLQHKILKTSDDQSIFAWTAQNGGLERGLLASSPEEFASCSDIVRRRGDIEKSAFFLSDKGLYLELPLIHYHGSLSLAVLQCESKNGHPLGIWIEKKEEKGGSFTYVRVHAERIEEVRQDIKSIKKSRLFIRSPGSNQAKSDIVQRMRRHAQSKLHMRKAISDPVSFDIEQWMKRKPPYIFSIRKRPEDRPSIEGNDTALWHVSENDVRLGFPESGDQAILVFRTSSAQVFAVALGVNNWNVWCDIADDCEDDDVKELSGEYWNGKRFSARTYSWDRRTACLVDGTLVSLALKQGQIGDERVTIVEVDASENFRLDKVGN